MMVRRLCTAGGRARRNRSRWNGCRRNRRYLRCIVRLHLRRTRLAGGRSASGAEARISGQGGAANRAEARGGRRLRRFRKLRWLRWMRRSFWKSRDWRRKLDGRFGRFNLRRWRRFSRLNVAGNGGCFQDRGGNLRRHRARRCDFRSGWRRRDVRSGNARRRDLGWRGLRFRLGLDQRCRQRWLRRRRRRWRLWFES